MFKVENLHPTNQDSSTKPFPECPKPDIGICEDAEEDSYSDFDSDSESDIDEMTWLDLEHLNQPAECAQSAYLQFQQALIDEQLVEISQQKYHELQPTFTPHFREVAINFMIDLNYRFMLTSDTLYSAILYFDQILCTIPITKQEIQLYAIVCYWIAAKMDTRKQPTVDQVNRECHSHFTLTQFIETEAKIVSAIHYFYSPHPKFFLRRFLQAAGTIQIELALTNDILEVAIRKYDFMGVKPSMLALACVLTALASLGHSTGIQKVLSIAMDFERDQMTQLVGKIAAYSQSTLIDSFKQKHPNIETCPEISKINFNFVPESIFPF